MCALPLVEVLIPTYGSQPPQWWSQVFAHIIAENGVSFELSKIRTPQSMMPDNNKNGVLESKEVHKLSLEEIEDQKKRGELTDINRVNLTSCFLSGDAEWSFWIDDDTVPPMGAIGNLLKLKRLFASGIYFLDGKHTPVAYMKQKQRRLYSSLLNYPHGSVIEVDAVGMGCALIHRSVFEKIRAEHRVMVRPNGTLLVLHQSMFKNNKPCKVGGDGYVQDGVYHMPLSEVPSDDTRPFPYFALEYSRTEDIHFCELAANVGIKPVVDTTVVCGHIKTRVIGEDDYKQSLPGELAKIDADIVREKVAK